MYDPEGGHKEPAGHPQVDEAIAAIITLPDLPPELILRIASLLEVRDLLALRRIHRSIYNISRDKLLWSDLLRNLRPPLPRALRFRHLDTLSYPELEEAVLDSCKVEDQWLKRRDPRVILRTRSRHAGIVLLDFMDDRWIISIPQSGPPIIWDAREDPPKLCKWTSNFLRGGTKNALVTVDPHQGDMIIAAWDGSPAFQILRVHPAGTGSDSFHLTNQGTIHPIPEWLFLVPSRSVVITGLVGGRAEIRDWTCNRSVMTNTTGEDMFGPILDLCLVGDYILCFRPKCIQLLSVPPFPDADEQRVSEHHPDPDPFYLTYQGIAFGGASSSGPQPNPESPDNSHIIYILACEPIVGFFYFRVTIYNPDYYGSSGSKAKMNVDLIGVYELEKPLVGVRGTSGPRVALTSWLGPEGKRGVWMEYSKTQPKRFIVAVSFDRNHPAGVPVESGDDLQELCKIAPQIESTGDVYVDGSWDRGGQIVLCAFSESTGKIVLGTRDDRIILL